MRVLGIDTTARHGGVAVTEGGSILAARQVEAPKGFGDVIYSLVEEALTEAGLRLDQIDLFAAASGPGSFTGVRVGLTAAKALGEALGRPVVGVSNLEALAAAANVRHCAVVFDARRQEVYGAVYGEDLAVLIPKTVSPWTELFEQAERFDPLWVSTDGSIFGPGGAAPLPAGVEQRIIGGLAAAVAHLAPWRLAAGQGAPELVEANYIRRPDAERNRQG